MKKRYSYFISWKVKRCDREVIGKTVVFTDEKILEFNQIEEIEEFVKLDNDIRDKEYLQILCFSFLGETDIEESESDE